MMTSEICSASPECVVFKLYEGVMYMTKVLVACEESQAVTIELRKLGVEAWEVDHE